MCFSAIDCTILFLRNHNNNDKYYTTKYFVRLCNYFEKMRRFWCYLSFVSYMYVSTLEQLLKMSGFNYKNV